MIETYFWKIKYYNDFLEKDIITYGTIGAESYSDAAKKLDKRFPDIDNMTIYEGTFCDGFTFFEDNEELWNQLLKSHKED